MRGGLGGDGGKKLGCGLELCCVQGRAGWGWVGTCRLGEFELTLALQLGGSVMRSGGGEISL